MLRQGTSPVNSPLGWLPLQDTHEIAATADKSRGHPSTRTCNIVLPARQDPAIPRKLANLHHLIPTPREGDHSFVVESRARTRRHQMTASRPSDSAPTFPQPQPDLPLQPVCTYLDRVPGLLCETGLGVDRASEWQVNPPA